MPRIKDVLIRETYPYLANQFRDAGYTPYAAPGMPWEGIDSMPWVPETPDILRQNRRWLNPKRLFVNPWGGWYDWLSTADYCARQRLPLFGPTTAAHVIEAQRYQSRQLMQKWGWTVGMMYPIRTAEEKAAVFAKAKEDYLADGTLYVIKAEYDMEYPNSYFNVVVPDTWDEFEWALRKWFIKYPLSLEERVEGIEVAFTVVVVSRSDSDIGEIALLPGCTNFEHKRTHNRNLGVPAGEVGTLMIRGVAPRVMEEIFAPMAGLLRQVGYTGYCDLNTIYSPKTGRWTPLEFTMRMGNPTHAILSELLNEPAQHLVEWGCGIPTKPNWRTNAACGIVVVPGGFPFHDACLQHIPCRLGPFAWGHFHRMSLHTHPTWGNEVVGGRQGVMAVGADDVATARQRLYDDMRQIEFENMQYRTDIGRAWEDWKGSLLEAALITPQQAEW